MKGTVMSIVDQLANATDKELREINTKLRYRLIKKFFLGVVVSVAVHFASAFVVGAIEKKR